MNRNRNNRINVDPSISSVVDSLKAYEKVLINVSDQFVYDQEGLDKGFMEKSITDIISTAEKITKLKAKCEVTSQVLNDFIDQSLPKINSPDSSIDDEVIVEDPKLIISRLNDKIEEDFSHNIPNMLSNSRFISSLKETLDIHKNKKSRINDDEDIEELYVEPTEGSFKCCYTQMLMTSPMKNMNEKNSCKHNISRDGLNSLLAKKTTCRCPVSGCSGMWTKSTSVLDKVFERKLNDWLLKQKRENQAQTQSSNLY